MKSYILYTLKAFLLTVICLLGACSEYEPRGYEEVPDLPKATNLAATIDGYTVTLSWVLPQNDNVSGVIITKNGNIDSPIRLDGRVTEYKVIGQPMGEDYFYTVKVVYEDKYVSEGESLNVVLPEIELAGVSDLKAAVSGRTVTLEWVLPSTGIEDVTGIRVLRDGEIVANLGPNDTKCVLKGQPIDATMTYTVELIYSEYYVSKPASVSATIPYFEAKIAYLLLAPDVQSLPDDDERAAAAWFATLPNAEFVQASQLASLDPEIYSVLWIEIDRMGIGLGWQNLPAEVSSSASIEALRNYTKNGGNLYLANMATQLTVPLEIVPENMAPTVFGDGAGGTGTDVWVINPFLGVDFKNGGDQGYYDRSGHAIFKGLTLEDPNNYGYLNLPLIGPGQREDHNCLWDCNIYGKGNQPDVIKNFEVTTNSLVLATWGHVRDHCVAGLVEFFANDDHGRVVANGFAAYEWNQNSGTNPYQHNVEQLTLNILNYLK